jgi:integrase
MPKTTGMVMWLSGEPYVRVRLASSRPYFRIRGCSNAAEVEGRAALVADIIRDLRKAQKANAIEDIARRAAEARSTDELEGVRMAVRSICNGEVAGRPKFDEMITFKQFAEKWYTGALHEAYPRQVKVKKTSDQDKQFLTKWVFPHIGDAPLLTVTIDDCEDVLNAVPETKSDHVARHVAQVMRRVFNLARYPVKLIKTSPIPPGFVPRIRTKKARTYLYADEDRLLLGCASIYLVLRLLYGLLDREGLRIDEALTLDFVDLDLKNGIIHLDKNKTDDPRPWALDPSVADALRLWKKHFHPKPAPNARVFVYPSESREVGQPLASATRAEELRANLRKAGCRRHQLFERSDERRPLCIHDLRATFVTISLANAKTESWVANRTGHKSSKMINEYRRQAECHRELLMGGLTPLCEAIPEFAAIRANLQRGSNAAAE